MGRMRWFLFFRAIFLSLAIGLLAGCGAGYASIEGRDNGALFPSVRVSYPILDKYDLHGQSYYAVEAGYSRGRGEDRQNLGTGENISFAGTIFPGPADVRQTFTLDVADVALRVRFPREALFFMEVLFGYRYKDLDLNLNSGDVTVERKLRNGGLAGGFGFGSRVSDRLMIELRFFLDFEHDRGQMGSADLMASYWLSPYAAITGGYRRWEYGRGFDTESNIDSLVWQGLTGGLALSF